MVEDEDYANGKTSQKDLQMRDDHAEAEAHICLEGFGYARRGKRWCDTLGVTDYVGGRTGLQELEMGTG